MSRADPPPEIIAALVWDVPALRAGSPSAQDFARALPGEPDLWWQPKQFADDPLGRAAHGVAHDRAGRPVEAAELYASLATDQEPWARLLGLMLRAWSDTPDGEADITAAHAHMADLTPPDELRARLLAKLATNAFDEGAVELGVRLLAEAIAAAPPDTRLERALAVEGLNVGLPYTWKEHPPPMPADALVDYVWIEADSRQAAQDTLAAAVESRARRLWTFHWSAGNAPLADVVAAEVQATWAGALWLRRPIRKQLGAQLLLGAATTPQQWAYGVVMWTLGSGQNPEGAYALAEPRLDQGASDFVVRTVADAEVAPRYGHRFLALAVAAWDGLSEETLRWAVERVTPTAGDDPQAASARRLWAGFAARAEAEWLPRFRKLDQPVRSALLDSLGRDVVRRMRSESRAAIYETASGAVRTDAELSTHLLRILAVTAPASFDQELRNELGEKAGPSAIAHLVYEGHHELLTDAQVAAARRTLIESVLEQQQEARGGKVSFGASDLRLDLGRLASGTRGPEPDAVGLLMSTAIDDRLPAEHLLYARIALGLLSRAGKLDAASLEQLREANDPDGTFAEHGNVTPELLQAQRLLVRGAVLTAEEAIWVTSACRAPDARVRQVALQTAGIATRTGGSTAEQEALAWGIVSGLFDPDDEVSAVAVGAVTDDFLRRFPSARRVVLDRLPRLLHQTSVDVRGAVAAQVRQWVQQDPALADDPVVRSVLAQVAGDRSWLVRHAGTRQSPEQAP